MEQSLFLQWVNKFFPGITVRVVETLNDSKNPITYLHRRMLRKDFSVTGKWETINSNNSLVMADVVAMDSSLPLKMRDSLSKASGDIPKMGMELKLNERQLTDLDTLVATGGTDAQIVSKLFQDTPKVIGGIYERNEAMFLEGLSSGVTLVEDTENVGTGVRVDYGYLPANKFGVTVLWNGNPTTAKPDTDIKRVLAKVKGDGNVITKVMLDSYALDALLATDQLKEFYAFKAGFVGTKIPALDLAQANTVTSARYGFTMELVDRTCKYEKNGTQTAVKPWAEGAVVFLTNDQVGNQVWAKLAEMNHPVQNVTYNTVDDFILVSKYRTNKPSLGEWTSSQARVVPVINNVNQIYTLDSKTVQA